MNIRPATEQDRQTWDQYVLEHPEGTLFHLWAWRAVVEGTFSHQFNCLLARKVENSGTDKIVGLLPLCRIKSSLFGHYLVASPFAEMGGVLADSPEVEKALVNKAIALAREYDCDYLELKNSHPVEGLLTKDLYFNFSKELLPEVEDNLQAIPRKSRAAVRKGIKSGLTATFGEDQIDTFYEMMARSYHSLGTPIFPKRFFHNFLNTFDNSSDLLIVRTPEEQPIAGVLTLYFKDRIMPYYAGSLPGYRHLCPNDFMYWELLKHGLEKGYKVFDYGRSKIDTGSYSFKKHWGFEPEPLAYQYQLIKLTELPNLSPANPKYAKKIAMWRKMPFALTKIIGPPLAKYLA